MSALRRGHPLICHRSQVTHVAKKYQTDAGLAGLLASLNIPYPTTAVHIGRRVGALPALIKKHNETVKELEEVLTTYLRHPDHVPTSRPTKRIGGKFGLGGQTVDSIGKVSSAPRGWRGEGRS